MPTPTYTLLASNVLSSSALSVTFSSIPSTYRDLVLVAFFNGATATAPYTQMRINGDTGSNYNWVRMEGSGTSAASDNNNSNTNFNFTYLNPAQGDRGILVCNFFDYSATDKHKTLLTRMDWSSVSTAAHAARWASTSVINQIEIYSWSPQYNSGSTFYLYGIVS